MTKKYKLDKNDTIKVDGRTLYRIIALVNIGTLVSIGDKGGYIESEANLSHEGRAWISRNACVYDNAWVYDSAWVSGNACVYGSAHIVGNAQVVGNDQVSGYAWVAGDACIAGCACIAGNALIEENDDYFCIQSFGLEGDTITFFREKNGWCVYCGCFSGTVKEFRKKVKETHRDSLISQEYLLIADLMDLRIKRQELKNEVK